MDTRLLFLALLGLFAVQAQDAEKTKRQIFREQVLPHNGGKIPESAFRSDRLALNKLQKLGVAVPDGVSLDTRSNSVVRVAHDPETEYTLIKILQEDEGRYIPPEGRSYPTFPRSVQSTYLLRPPIGSLHLNHHYHRSIPGPALSLGGASLEATAGQGTHQYVNPVTSTQHVAAPQPTNAYLPPVPPPTPSTVRRPYPSPAYPKVVTRYGAGTFAGRPQALSTSQRLDAASSYGFLPQQLQYSTYGNFETGFKPSAALDFLQSSSYSNLYSPGSSFSNGLLHLRSPYQSAYANYYNPPASNSLYPQHLGLLDDDLYRLRRRTAGETSPAESKVREVFAAPSSCSAPGVEIGKVYAASNSGCKKYFSCLSDGRTAEYVCPEGSVFNIHKGRCQRGSIQLNQNCEPVA